MDLMHLKQVLVLQYLKWLTFVSHPLNTAKTHTNHTLTWHHSVKEPQTAAFWTRPGLEPWRVVLHMSNKYWRGSTSAIYNRKSSNASQKAMHQTPSSSETLWRTCRMSSGRMRMRKVLSWVSKVCSSWGFPLNHGVQRCKKVWNSKLGLRNNKKVGLTRTITHGAHLEASSTRRAAADALASQQLGATPGGDGRADHQVSGATWQKTVSGQLWQPCHYAISEKKVEFL